MVWIKDRTAAEYNRLYDTARGATKVLYSNVTNQEGTEPTSLTSFNSDGFTLGSVQYVNRLNDKLVSWTFKKQPRFFDMVKYTGNGVAGREIAHELGCDVGMMIVKRTDVGESWYVYHTSLGETKKIYLHLTNAAIVDSSPWNNTAPTDAVFALGGDSATNILNGEYIAYLYAHDPLGASGDGSDSMIQCGSYVGNGTSQEIDLGWEPQYILVKDSTVVRDWIVHDTMRGWGADGVDHKWLEPNTSDAEAPTIGAWLAVQPTGFKAVNAQSRVNASGSTYIYMAIRRPMKTPLSSDEVFAIDTFGSTADGKAPAYRSGFPVDMSIRTGTTGAHIPIQSRLTGTGYMFTDSTTYETTTATWLFDYMNGWRNSTSIVATDYSWMFKRAKGFFDVVAYTGSNTNSTFNHNLASIPEMMFVKCRTDGATNRHWGVYHKDFTGILYLDESWLGNTSTGFFPSPPTDTEFYVGAGWSVVNELGNDWIAYLFTTLAGISKVGSYTGNGTSQTIDCGFSTGVKFLLLKRTDGVGNWMMWDSVRGIVDGIDPYLLLNTTDAEASTGDYVDQVSPAQNGFTLTPSGNWLYGPNYDTAEYIYYAIANPI